nr:MAG TPA: Z DNA-binding protein [Caudoviricetes sp.]
MKAEVLLDLLSGKPVTRREIRQQTGYPDREIRQAVRDLRLSGVRVVTAENGGYFIARSEEEYIPFRNSMISRVVKIMEVVNAMDRNLNGQVILECTGAKSAEQ